MFFFFHHIEVQNLEVCIQDDACLDLLAFCNESMICVCREGFVLNQSNICVQGKFYSSPTENFLDRSKLETFTNEQSTLALLMKFLSKSVEKIVEKGENAGCQHFLLFPQCFQIYSSPGL